jgi:hypothetical protein
MEQGEDVPVPGVGELTQFLIAAPVWAEAAPGVKFSSLHAAGVNLESAGHCGLRRHGQGAQGVMLICEALFAGACRQSLPC